MNMSFINNRTNILALSSNLMYHFGKHLKESKMSRKIGVRNLKTTEERFMSKVEIDKATGCWNTLQGTILAPFVIDRNFKKNMRHAAWYLKYGEIANGELEPICGNRKCVNPEHIRLLSTWEDRFWRFVDKKGDDECWNWTANKDRRGYGLFNNSITTKAHRLSWIISNGDIPDGMVICHKCDNPSCVNPNHLFIGTIKDNNLDKEAKGRARGTPGERNFGAILNEKQVNAIRFLYDSGKFSTYDLSDIFQVSRNAISRIVNRITWRHI